MALYIPILTAPDRTLGHVAAPVSLPKPDTASIVGGDG